jgi:hydrogenase maturation factor
MTVVRDALTAMAAGGVTAMHDATEGGVIGGLAEVAEASGVGMAVDEARFVYPDEVRMVCEAFGIDPVAAIAEGSLIITADATKAGRILGDLGKAGIAASVIGTVTSDIALRVMKRRDGSEVPLRMPDQDPFWPVFFEGMK